MRAVFLNGPPGCGKDYAASVLVPKKARFKFAAPIKKVVGELTGASTAWLEENKATPSPLFDMTYREMMISVSEHWMKPVFGPDIFGRLLLRQLAGNAFPLIAISDAGFLEEVNAVAAHLGPENCFLFRIRRPGCDFAYDSRSYIHPAFPSKDIFNDGSPSFAGKLQYEIARRFP